MSVTQNIQCFYFKHQFLVLRSLHTCLSTYSFLLVTDSLISYAILPATARKSQCSFALSQISYFWTWKNQGHLVSRIEF